MIKDLKKVREIWGKLMFILSREQKLIGALVLFMSIVSAGFELLGVSIILPLVQSMVEPEKLMRSSIGGQIVVFFGLHDIKAFIIYIYIFTGIIYVIKNLYFVLLTYVSAKFSCKVLRELGVKMMRSYMKRGYSFFLSTDTSKLYRGMDADLVGVYDIINYGIIMVKNTLTLGIIVVFLFVTDWVMTICILAAAMICLLLVVYGFRKIVKKNGELNREYSAGVTKIVLEVFQGIKEVMVMRRQKYFVSSYEKAFKGVQKTQIKKTLADTTPSYILESVCIIVLLSVVCFRYVSTPNPAAVVPQLAAIAVAAIRILPALGNISGGINIITFKQPALNAVYENLKEIEAYSGEDEPRLEQEITSNIRFNRELALEHVYWKYFSGGENVLQDFSLSITKGESVAIIGKSGAGKSTLADIILGLLKPQMGKVTVDEQDIFKNPEAWSRIIGYVPQNNYLIDDTIRKNIAFGIEEDKIDDMRLEDALRKAQLFEYVRELQEGVNTVVGERGVRFSGGQKQRIVIARALYHNPDILILDEATSALDNETENAVMEAIDALKGEVTLLIVAHRLSTIRKCDKVYEIVNGQAIERNLEDILKGC